MPHESKYNTWISDQIYYVNIAKTARDSYSPYPRSPPYMQECFLSIQDSIERGFIEATSGKSAPPTKMQRFAFPSISEDMFVSMAGLIFPLVFVICMLASMKNIIKVSDKLRNEIFSVYLPARFRTSPSSARASLKK